MKVEIAISLATFGFISWVAVLIYAFRISRPYSGFIYQTQIPRHQTKTNKSVFFIVRLWAFVIFSFFSGALLFSLGEFIGVKGKIEEVLRTVSILVSLAFGFLPLAALDTLERLLFFKIRNEMVNGYKNKIEIINNVHTRIERIKEIESSLSNDRRELEEKLKGQNIEAMCWARERLSHVNQILGSVELALKNKREFEARQLKEQLEEQQQREKKAAEKAAVEEIERNKEIARQRAAKHAFKLTVTSAIEACNVGVGPKIIKDIADLDDSEWGAFDSSRVRFAWDICEKLLSVIFMAQRNHSLNGTVNDVTHVLAQIAGGRLIQGAKVMAKFEHYGNGSHTEINATLLGQPTTLEAVFVFDNSFEGLCSAFFVAHILPTMGREWHSLYSKDYKFALNVSELADIVIEQHGSASVPALNNWGSRPGLNIRRSGSKISLQSIGGGPTTSLAMFGIDIVDGVIVEVIRETILKSSVRILY